MNFAQRSTFLHVSRVRYVYVGMHADGPTRVLCFSEVPDEYARGSAGGGGDTLALLSARLERAQQRIQVGSVASIALEILLLKALHILIP